jgi:hypothetical protein
MESCTALAENENGLIEMVNYDPFSAARPAFNRPTALPRTSRYAENHRGPGLTAVTGAHYEADTASAVLRFISRPSAGIQRKIRSGVFGLLQDAPYSAQLRIGLALSHRPT